jgi:alpha-methylacyl-CoA racemase
MRQNKPLSGVRVLDLTQLLPGPMCTLHLADMGAEVIKVEPPEYGDPVRGGKGKFSTMFLMLNRNKRSLEVNLRSEEGLTLLKKLVATADVLVEGFRPGVTERLGIGYQAMATINPKLVYCSITGYGQEGPLSQVAGHDINYQSLTGVLEQTGKAGGPPAQGNLPAADLAGGSMSAATGILAALFDAQRSGKGRFVDIAMADCLMSLNILATTAWQQSGHQQIPRGEDFLSGGLAAYHIYETSDGRHLAVGAVEMKFWTNFCDAIGRVDLYKRGHLPGKAGYQAKAEVAAVIAEYDLAHWTKVFANVDACTTPVLRIDEALKEPNVAARNMVIKSNHPQAGDYLQYACPLKMTDFDNDEPAPAPSLGADNAAILAEFGL